MVRERGASGRRRGASPTAHPGHTAAGVQQLDGAALGGDKQPSASCVAHVAAPLSRLGRRAAAPPAAAARAAAATAAAAAAARAAAAAAAASVTERRLLGARPAGLGGASPAAAAAADVLPRRGAPPPPVAPPRGLLRARSKPESRSRRRPAFSRQQCRLMRRSKRKARSEQPRVTPPIPVAYQSTSGSTGAAISLAALGRRLRSEGDDEQRPR